MANQVGLDSEINELVEGSDLYEPAVNLSQVVLPPGHLDALLSHCMAYETFREYRLTSGLQNRLSYGNGLVVLFCGKSGTGARPFKITAYIYRLFILMYGNKARR
jgi:hypothetical protein